MKPMRLADNRLPSEVQQDRRHAEALTRISLANAQVTQLQAGVAGRCHRSGLIEIDRATVANDNRPLRQEVLVHEALHKASDERGDNAHYVTTAFEEGVNTKATKQLVGTQHCYFAETAMIDSMVSTYNARMRNSTALARVLLPDAPQYVTTQDLIRNHLRGQIAANNLIAHIANDTLPPRQQAVA